MSIAKKRKGNLKGKEGLKRQNKDSLSEKHIEDGAGENGKQHIPFPTMYAYGCGQGKKFRESVISAKNRNISKTIH